MVQKTGSQYTVDTNIHSTFNFKLLCINIPYKNLKLSCFKSNNAGRDQGTIKKLFCLCFLEEIKLATLGNFGRINN